MPDIQIKTDKQFWNFSFIICRFMYLILEIVCTTKIWYLRLFRQYLEKDTIFKHMNFKKFILFGKTWEFRDQIVCYTLKFGKHGDSNSSTICLDYLPRTDTLLVMTCMDERKSRKCEVPIVMLENAPSTQDT